MTKATSTKRSPPAGSPTPSPQRKAYVPSLVVASVLTAYFFAVIYPLLNLPRPRNDDQRNAFRMDERSRRAGWNPEDVQNVDTSFCNIPRVSMSEISRSEFQDTYLEKRPVILVGSPNAENRFASVVERDVLLETFGNSSITLSSANRNSYDKREVPLRTYLDRAKYMKPQTLYADGASTWYHFGDNKHDQWDEGAFQYYERPNRFTFGPHSSLSFGIGPAGSGVPFHTHGHVFNEVIYGKKRWWLQAPKTPTTDDDGPRFDPDASTLQWLDRVRPTLMPAEVAELHECVCVPGETLYIPSFWHHATLNVGETVFMAVFV